MTSNTDIADTYGIVLPSEWNEIPLEKDDFERYRESVLNRLRSIPDWTKTAERKLEMLFSQIRNDLLASNTRMAAVVAESEEVDSGFELLVAGATISRVDREALGVRMPLTTDVLIAVLGKEPREDGKVRYVNLEPAREVQLPAGPAVRIRRHYTASPAPAQVMEYYADIFLVPHDGGEAVCTLQFTTPNVEDGSAFSTLFEAIARTLRIFMPGDPTDFSDSASGG